MLDHILQTKKSVLCDQTTSRKQTFVLSVDHCLTMSQSTNINCLFKQHQSLQLFFNKFTMHIKISNFSFILKSQTKRSEILYGICT